MGVDVHVIIRHNFYEVDNFEKAVNFVKETINGVQKRLHIDGDLEDYFEFYACEEQDYLPYIRFEIPILGVSVYLRKGYWSVWTGWHTCQVSNKLFGRLHVADMAFDVARALGEIEAWYCDEYLEDECENKTLDELIKIANKRYGIAEYPYAELMKYEDGALPPFKPFYHDSFNVILKEYEALCKTHGEYTIPCIRNYCPGFIRVIYGDKVNLLNRNSGMVFFENDVDSIHQIGVYEVACGLNGKVALYDIDKRPLTGLVDGTFEMKPYEKSTPFDKFHKRYIVNDVAKIKILATYHDDGKIEYVNLPYNSLCVKRKPAKCSVCKGKVVPIVYGEPSCEISQKADRKEVVLGGCIITGNDPDWECIECHTKYVKE